MFLLLTADILTTYSLSTIIVILIGVAFAVKEIIELVGFFKEKAKNALDKEDAPKKEYEEIMAKLDNISAKQRNIEEVIYEQQGTLDLLVESDKDQIKSAIVKDYHHFMNKGWIDDFSMDTLEKCFQHYREEGGNTYICDLMQDLRRLPNDPSRINK